MRITDIIPFAASLALHLHGNDSGNWLASPAAGGTPGAITHPPTQITIDINGLSDGTGLILWEAVPGHEYTVEYCDDLAGPWFTLETIAPTTTMVEMTDPDFLTTSRRFYRIR